VGGPWFTVQESSSDWEQIDTLWISNGEEHVRARVEIRVQLDEVDH